MAVRLEGNGGGGGEVGGKMIEGVKASAGTEIKGRRLLSRRLNVRKGDEGGR